MEEIKTVSKEELQDPDNYNQCECGSYGHSASMVFNEEGQYYCSKCHRDWLESVIDMYKKLYLEARKAFPKEATESIIKDGYADLMGFTREEFDEIDYDIGL